MHNLVKFLNSKEQILLMLPFRKNKLLGKKKKDAPLHYLCNTSSLRESKLAMM